MSRKSLRLISWLHTHATYFLLIPILLVCLLPGPALLGNWESLTFYHTFGAFDAPLTFLISPRANVGGQGYALLEMTKAIILGLGLPLNLATFRIPSVIFGTVSLLLFFTICKRHFGPWPSVGATALLAGNPVFFQFEHMMTVVVVSGAALLFVIERLQVLEIRYWDPKAWLGFSLSLVFVSLHYGPARIFAVILIGVWFANVYWQLKDIPSSETMQHGIWILGGYSAATFLLLLTLLDPRNLISILRFSTFLLPKDAETVAIATNLTEGKEFAKTIETNLGILVDSVLSHVGSYNAQYSSYIFADFRYPLLNELTLAFVIAGFIVSVILMRRRTVMFAAPWRNALIILIVLSLPLLFSEVVFKPNSLIATLSVYRMYFCLFPLHLLVAAFLGWLAASEVNKVGKYGVAVLVIVIFANLVIDLIDEHARFKNQVFAPTWQMHGPIAHELWSDHMGNMEKRGSTLLLSHFQQHAQYANVAKQIAAKLRAQGEGAAGRPRLIFVDVNTFSEALTMPMSLPYIANRNFHSIFLALYAGEEGVKINPIMMVSPDRKPINPFQFSRLAYGGKPREYSALMELDSGGILTYGKVQDTIPVIANFTGRADYDILVTTPEEENGARSLLEKQGVSFEYLKFQAAP